MPYIDFEQLMALEAAVKFDSDIQWSSAGCSHIGQVRKVNEDAFYHSTEQGLWVVADGMGGLARGDYASSVVVDACVHFTQSNTLAGSIRDLEIRLRRAHENCRQAFRGERVGSTVVALLSYGQHSFFLWAGDSRVYRLRGDQLKQMTVDHTAAQGMYARGEISAKKAMSHPAAHVLTRAVGVHQTLHLELSYEAVERGDRFLLCTDGVYNDLDRGEILQRLAKGAAQASAQDLIDGALERGGNDNITAMVIDAG